MKILLVMESWDMANGPYETLYPYFHQILTSLGHDVQVVDNKRNYLPIGGNTMWDYSHLLQRFRWGQMNDRIINLRLCQSANRYRPDLILLIKCENITSHTISWLKQYTQAIIFNWDHDNPFWHSNTTINLLRSIGIYDCFGIWGKFLIPALYSIGCRRIEFLPMFFNVQRFSSADNQYRSQAASNLACDIAFIGNGSLERAEMLRHLSDFNLGIWGNWSVLAPDDPLRKNIRGYYLDGIGYSQVLRNTKIAVNVLNLSNRPGSNTRTFEATGLGRLLLTEYTEEQAKDLFQEDNEIICFRSPEDLKEKAQYYLAHETARERIAQAGQIRTLREHTLQHRLQQIINVTFELLDQKCVISQQIGAI